MGDVVVVTGADGALGRRVVAETLGEPGVDRVVALGLDPAGLAELSAAGAGGAELVVAPWALDDPRLGSALSGATRLVHLGGRHGADLDGTGGAEIDLLGTRALLATLARVAGVHAVVVLSSALVYGVRANNPVPLTEDAPVRPNPSIPAAVERSQLEAMVASWATERSATCALLRPCVVVGPENGRWLARSPWATAGIQSSSGGAPVQFLHLDDLVTAVGVAGGGVDGPLNAAPDGWLTFEQVKALKGPALRLRVRLSRALRLARLGSRVGLVEVEPTAILATSAPWVVANDRLRSLGWEPTFTNEEAYVDADRGGPWARLTPRHRQELALGGATALVVAGAGIAAWLVRRRLRRGS